MNVICIVNIIVLLYFVNKYIPINFIKYKWLFWNYEQLIIIYNHDIYWFTVESTLLDASCS